MHGHDAGCAQAREDARFTTIIPARLTHTRTPAPNDDDEAEKTTQPIATFPTTTVTRFAAAASVFRCDDCDDDNDNDDGPHFLCCSIIRNGAV